MLRNRLELAAPVSRRQERGAGERHLLSLPRGHRMKRLLSRMLDKAEFPSRHGVPSASRHQAQHPFVLGVRAARPCASNTGPASRARLPSAAAPTGAAPSGCR